MSKGCWFLLAYFAANSHGDQRDTGGYAPEVEVIRSIRGDRLEITVHPRIRIDQTRSLAHELVIPNPVLRLNRNGAGRLPAEIGTAVPFGAYLGERFRHERIALLGGWLRVGDVSEEVVQDGVVVLVDRV